jgi:hypothetical protein
VLCCFALAPARAHAASLQALPSTLVIPVGEQFEVLVRGEAFANGVDGGDFTVGWSSGLGFVAIAIPDPPWDLSSFDASTAPLGYLDYVDVFSSATTPGEDEEPFGIATLTLQATAVGVASITLGPSLVGWSVFGGRYSGVSYGAASVEIVPVPEPTTAALVSCGLCLLAAIRTSIRPCVRGSKERR